MSIVESYGFNCLSNPLNNFTLCITDFNTNALVSSVSPRNTGLPKYYARLKMAVACGLGRPACRQMGPHTDAAPKHSLLFQFSLSRQSHLMFLL